MEAYEYTFVRNQIFHLIGIDLNHYPGPQIQQRLESYLARSDHTNWSHFFHAISDDPIELRKFRDYLTTNVSSFFQNTKKLQHLKAFILPELLRRRSKLYVWSAGCSHGHELYTLAIILAEVSGFYHKHYILATDTDRSVVEWAQAGGPYSSEEVKRVAPHLLDYYFTRSLSDDQNTSYYIIEKLRRKVVFHHQDPLTTPFKDKFDLITCCDVETVEARDHLYRRLHDALRPGGMLFVDNTQAASQIVDLGFEMAVTSFYRRKE